jgi:transcriptional regulator with XRE-family HTH domain
MEGVVKMIKANEPKMSEQEWLDIFAANLRDIMREKRYTQRDLSRATGISESAISKYLTARAVPSTEAIILMSYEFCIIFTDFIDFGSMIE